MKTIVMKIALFLVSEFQHFLHCVFKDNVGHALLKPNNNLNFRFSRDRDQIDTAALFWNCVMHRTGSLTKVCFVVVYTW